MRSTFVRGVVVGSLTAVLVLGASAALAGTRSHASKPITTIFTLVKGPTVSVDPGSQAGSTAVCPSGSGPVGSGFNVIVGGPGYLEALAPDTTNGTTADGWLAVVANPSTNTTALTFHAWAVCANQTITLP